MLVTSHYHHQHQRRLIQKTWQSTPSRFVELPIRSDVSSSLDVPIERSPTPASVPSTLPQPPPPPAPVEAVICPPESTLLVVGCLEIRRTEVCRWMKRLRRSGTYTRFAVATALSFGIRSRDRVSNTFNWIQQYRTWLLEQWSIGPQRERESKKDCEKP